MYTHVVLAPNRFYAFARMLCWSRSSKRDMSITKNLSEKETNDIQCAQQLNGYRWETKSSAGQVDKELEHVEDSTVDFTGPGKDRLSRL